MRGEQSSLQSRASQSRGSPPHARGAGFFRNFLGAAGGITPACAGSSQCKGLTSAFQWDHPRMRGEQQVNDASVPVREGSPPHARGAELLMPGQPAGRGITPACAGSSSRFRIRYPAAQDHPRMRGEQPVRRPGAGAAGGITPACAGSSDSVLPPAVFPGDHPRMRGEQAFFRALASGIAGSPPHARGAESAASWVCPGRGITPACAGSR